METRLALIGIILEDDSAAAAVNRLLHEYSDAIIGRMGIPYRPKNLRVISVVIDAPQNTISALSGKLGQLSGVSTKTVYDNH